MKTLNSTQIAFIIYSLGVILLTAYMWATIGTPQFFLTH